VSTSTHQECITLCGVQLSVPVAGRRVYLLWAAGSAWFVQRPMRSEHARPVSTTFFLAGHRLSPFSLSTPATSLNPAPNHLQFSSTLIPHPQPPLCVRLYVLLLPGRFLLRASTPRSQGQQNIQEQQLTTSCNQQVHLQTGQCVSVLQTHPLRHKLTVHRVTKLVPPSGRPSPASTASTAPVSTMELRISSSSA
jgi:hypothetical protein